MLQTKRTRIDKLGVPPQNPLGSMIGLSTIVALLIGGGLASGLVWQGRQLPTPENWLLGDPFVAAGHGVAAAAAILISLFGMLAIKRNSELTYIDKSKVVWSEAIDYARNSHLRFTADELGGAYESFRRFWSVDLQGRVHLLCVIASLPGVLALFGAIRNLQASPPAMATNSILGSDVPGADWDRRVDRSDRCDRRRSLGMGESIGCLGDRVKGDDFRGGRKSFFRHKYRSRTNRDSEGCDGVGRTCCGSSSKRRADCYSTIRNRNRISPFRRPAA